MEQISIFDLIPDAPPATHITIRIKYADFRGVRGSEKIVTTREGLDADLRKWREEHKGKVYYLGLEEV